MKLIIFLLLFPLTVFSKNIEFTVHHNPGGPSDKVTRIINNFLPKEYVVVNRPGAQGINALTHLSKGEGLMIATMTQIFVTNSFNKNIKFNINDLELIGVIGHMPNILICNKKHKFNSFYDFLNSNLVLSFGVAGYGSSEHLSTEILFFQTNKQHQIIPYSQGGAQSLTDLLSGNIDCMFANYPLVIEHLNDSRLIILMSTHKLLPNVISWEEIYKRKFPIQNSLGVVISKTINTDLKEKIINDLTNVIGNEILFSNIKNIGILPILKLDNKTIKDTLDNNLKIKEFILKSNIKLN